jgi:hypothetical protein
VKGGREGRRKEGREEGRNNLKFCELLTLHTSAWNEPWIGKKKGYYKCEAAKI